MNQFTFTPFPNLTTERFALRQLKIEDEDEIFAIRSDDNILKYLDRPKANAIDDARQFINKINDSISKNELIYWAINLKDNSKLIGTICLWKISTQQSNAEVGFELLPDHQGKGVMQGVLPKIIDFGFKTIKLQLIEGEVAANNLKSVILLEKHGFVINRRTKNTVVYSLSNSKEKE
ncbi:MAG: GNAT family N-acetyltransferase [Bacteroidetes bacterium]|nr:GNAT family N-acetyltransferase [Bacteroidota bacterium]